jgi:hypothetical protein
MAVQTKERPYEAFVTVRIEVIDADEGNALLRAYDVSAELFSALPEGACFANDAAHEIYATLRPVGSEVA